MHNRFYVEETLTDALGKETVLNSILNHVKAFRIHINQEIKLYDGSGKIFTGIIKLISKKDIIVEIISFETVQENPVKINLFLPLITSNSMDLMFSKICELNIANIYPIVTKRSIRFKENIKNKMERWNKISASACVLAGKSIMTGINAPINFNESLDLCNAYNIKLIAAPAGGIFLTDFLKNYLENESNKITESNSLNAGIFIGPEGDFTSDELDMAKNSGFGIVKLSNHIMSTFTAALFSASVIVSLCGGY